MMLLIIFNTIGEAWVVTRTGMSGVYFDLSNWNCNWKVPLNLELMVLVNLCSLVGPFMDPLHLPDWHQSGQHHNFPPGQITVSPGEAWKHCEYHILWFLQCFEHHTACTPGGQADAHGGGPTPHILNLYYLTNRQKWGLRTTWWTQ